MNEIEKRFEGGCYCGEIRFEIVGPPSWSAHCHCRSCQLAVGGAFATWARVAADRFAVTRGQIKICEKSPGITRGFCGNCGTTLTYAAQQTVNGQDWSEDAWFSAVALDDPSIAVPQTHVYVSHQQSWIKLADDLPTFPQF